MLCDDNEMVVGKLRAQLHRANQTIFTMREREKKLRDRLVDIHKRNSDLTTANHKLLQCDPQQSSWQHHHHAHPASSCTPFGSGGGPATYDISSGDRRPATLVRSFSDLYSTARLDTLDALDALPDLKSQMVPGLSANPAASGQVDMVELKNKLLFSVIVLSFRSALATVDKMRDHLRRVLQLRTGRVSSKGVLGGLLTAASSQSSKSAVVVVEETGGGGGGSPAARDMETSFEHYLRRSSDVFDLSKNYEDVCAQLWATLYDYPCLKKCKGLHSYIESCVRASWGLVNQVPPYVIEYERRNFDPDFHVRHHSADASHGGIKTYLWPALTEGHKGPCVHKAVVIT